MKYEKMAISDCPNTHEFQNGFLDRNSLSSQCKLSKFVVTAQLKSISEPPGRPFRANHTNTFLFKTWNTDKLQQTGSYNLRTVGTHTVTVGLLFTFWISVT